MYLTVKDKFLKMRKTADKAQNEYIRFIIELLKTKYGIVGGEIFEFEKKLYIITRIEIDIKILKNDINIYGKIYQEKRCNVQPKEVLICWVNIKEACKKN